MVSIVKGFMAKKFFPEIFEFVPASKPHPEDTHYKVSIGQEEWENGFVSVAKVQMVYDGVVSGRRSPSYPVGSNDHKKVREVIDRLIKKKAKK